MAKERYIPNIRNEKCCACQKALRNKKSSKNIRRIGQLSIERIRTFFNSPSIQVNDLICRKCLSKSVSGKINQGSKKK
jgi:hypothetical protein